MSILVKILLSLVAIVLAFIPTFLFILAWQLLIPTNFWQKIILIIIGLLFGFSWQICFLFLLMIFFGLIWLND